MQKIAVGDVMTRKVVIASPEDTLHDCARKMARERVNTLPITNKKRLVGIITSRYILWTLTKKVSADLSKINVMEIATRKVAVIKPSADISEALKKMQTLNFRRLPVLSRGDIIGMVTLKDILSIDPSLYSEMQELMDLREQERKLLAREEHNTSDLGIYDNLEDIDEQ